MSRYEIFFAVLLAAWLIVVGAIYGIAVSGHAPLSAFDVESHRAAPILAHALKGWDSVEDERDGLVGSPRRMPEETMPRARPVPPPPVQSKEIPGTDEAASELAVISHLEDGHGSLDKIIVREDHGNRKVSVHLHAKGTLGRVTWFKLKAEPTASRARFGPSQRVMWFDREARPQGLAVDLHGTWTCERRRVQPPAGGVVDRIEIGIHHNYLRLVLLTTNTGGPADVSVVRSKQGVDIAFGY